MKKKYKIIQINSFKMKDALTKKKVKLSMVVCCVRDNVALSVSHNPVELITFGFRLTNDRMVWETRYRHVFFSS